MSLRPSPAALLTLGFIALSIAACGRAGPLEAPPLPNEVQEQPGIDQDTPGAMPSPVPKPQKRPKRPITVPNEPFFLDPIL